MNRRAMWLRIAGLALTLSMLTACGEGGGSGATPLAPPPPTPPAPAASIASFSVAPTALNASGGAVTLIWQTSNTSNYALSVHPSTGVIGLPGGATTVTSLSVMLPGNTGATAVTYIFTLTANGAAGTPPATASTQVTVVAGNSVAVLPGVNWPAQVIYFLMTDRFDNGNTANDNGGPGDDQAAQPQNPMGWYGGDFQGVTDRIDAGYFTQLGATAIWMTPPYLQGAPQPGPAGNNPDGWQQFPYHGYWPWNFDAPDPHFGSIADLQTLVQTAHNNYLAIMLGQIVNDAGYGDPPYVQESNAIVSGQLTLDNSAMALQTFLFHHADPVTGQCEPYAGTYNAMIDCPLDGLPDFNSDNTNVQTMLDQATAGWLTTYGLDAIRLDAAMYVPESFWAQYFAYLKSQNLAPYAIAEIFDGAPDFVGGFTQTSVGFDGAENYPLYYAITQSGLVPNQPPYYGYTNLAAVNYAVQQNLANDAQPYLMVNFIDDQDVPRFTSMLTNNGVMGSDVLAHWQIAEVLSFTLPGIPMIYYGDEAGMAGTWDPYQAVANGTPSDNIRQPMTLFTAAQRQAAGVQGYYIWLQTLAHMRTQQAALATGVYTPLFVPSSSDPNIYVYLRGSGTGSVLVAINATGVSVDLSQLPNAGSGLVVPGMPVGALSSLIGGTSSLSLHACGSNTCLTGTLAPWSAQVVAP